MNWKIKAAVDVDGNEFPDFLWHHQVSGALVVWYMNGTTLMSGQMITAGQVIRPGSSSRLADARARPQAAVMTPR
jgi:hypothetical protein